MERVLLGLAPIIKSIRRRLLRRRALGHRQTLNNTQFVVVAGSQGKTTAAKLMHHFLALDGPSLLSAYWNTESDTWGRLLKVRCSDRYAVFEVTETMIGGDQMADSLSAVRPDAAMITLVANDHFSEFRSREVAAEHIAQAVQAVGPGCMVALNADDSLVSGMADRAAARVVTYGVAAAADYRAINIEETADGRLRFDCVHADKSAAFEMQMLGRHFLTSVLGAIAIASEYGIPLAGIADRARSFVPVPGRCSLHRGSNGTIVVCDTVKAVYDTMAWSFTVADAFSLVPRKTIVIGTISDYPGSARSKYQNAYLAARDHADRIVMYGPNALRARPRSEDLSGGRFMATESMAELSEYLAATALPGELILLKSSATDHLERIALAMEKPISCAIGKCGRRDSCFSCEMLRNPAPPIVRLLTRRIRRIRARFSREPEFR